MQCDGARGGRGAVSQAGCGIREIDFCSYLFPKAPYTVGQVRKWCSEIATFWRRQNVFPERNLKEKFNILQLLDDRIRIRMLSANDQTGDELTGSRTPP